MLGSVPAKKIMFDNNGAFFIEEQIKQDYFNQLIKPHDASVQFESLEIEKEYGEFEGYIVVRFYPVIIRPARFTPIEIGGVITDWAFADRIIAWKEGQVFTLVIAQENNLLSQESLREIVLMGHIFYFKEE